VADGELDHEFPDPFFPICRRNPEGQEGKGDVVEHRKAGQDIELLKDKADGFPAVDGQKPVRHA
jgi:hypothetical protein